MGALQLHNCALRDGLSVVFKAHDPAPGPVSRQEHRRRRPAEQRTWQAGFWVAPGEGRNCIAPWAEAQKHNGLLSGGSIDRCPAPCQGRLPGKAFRRFPEVYGNRSRPPVSFTIANEQADVTTVKRLRRQRVPADKADRASGWFLHLPHLLSDPAILASKHVVSLPWRLKLMANVSWLRHSGSRFEPASSAGCITKCKACQPFRHRGCSSMQIVTARHNYPSLPVFGGTHLQ